MILSKGDRFLENKQQFVHFFSVCLRKTIEFAFAFYCVNKYKNWTVKVTLNQTLWRYGVVIHDTNYGNSNTVTKYAFLPFYRLRHRRKGGGIDANSSSFFSWDNGKKRRRQILPLFNPLVPVGSYMTQRQFCNISVRRECSAQRIGTRFHCCKAWTFAGQLNPIKSVSALSLDLCGWKR